MKTQKPEKTQKRIFKPIVSILIVLASIFGAFMAIKSGLNLPVKYSKAFFKVSSIESFENKLTVLLTTGYYLAIYLLVTELFIMSYRFVFAQDRLTGKNPVNSKQDPRWVVCLNRIIGNTIEQSFIFFPIYLYWLHVFNINNSRIAEALGYPLLFLFGRLFFAVGYISGSVVNIFQLRTFGFSMNLIVTSFLLFQTQGINLKAIILG